MRNKQPFAGANSHLMQALSCLSQAGATAPCMQLSKEVRALRAYESSLLDSYHAYLKALLRVSCTGAGVAAQLTRLWLHKNCSCAIPSPQEANIFV